MDRSDSHRGNLLETLSLRPETESRFEVDLLVMNHGHVQSRLPLRDPGLKAALTRLRNGPATEDELFAAAIDSHGDGSVMALPMVLRRLESGGWLSFAATDASGRVVTRVDPRGHFLDVMTRRVIPTSILAVSEQSLIRRVGGVTFAESPLTGWDLSLLDVSWVGVLLSFDGSCSVDEVATAVGRPTEDVVMIADQAVRSGALRFVDDPEVPGLHLWSLPDLWFHTMSRVGSHRGGYGGTYHREGSVQSEPAIRPRFDTSPERWTAFAPLDLEHIGQNDPPFSQVVTKRASIRSHDDSNPITVSQLGELLGRVGAVKATMHDGRHELSFRQIPSGGALHELEMYPLVHHCSGIEAGLYHYDAGGHGLELIRAADPQTRLLLEYAQRTSTMDTTPQVSILVAARFGRAMWKYESMAYALILKHVGVLYEALYLTATAMGLACCALGGGNSQAFATATGLPMFVEGSVGEFVIGSRPAVTDEMEAPGST